MTKEEFTLKISALESEFIANKKALQKKFAFENNTFKIGDIITDGIHTIIIKNIRWTAGSILYGDSPQCVFEGDSIKNGKISKREPTATIYQSSIKTP